MADAAQAAVANPSLRRPRLASATDGLPVEEAVLRASHWLLERQDPAGFWCFELEGDSILQSEYILLLATLGRQRSPEAERAARQLLDQQEPHGGWGRWPGDKIDVGTSVKAYFALKLAGHDPDSAPLAKAREVIRSAGGADVVNSFTRFYLAMLGQIPYSLCPAVPPEMVLLPTWAPINMYRMSAWSRTIFVPLSIVWAYQPVYEIPARDGVDELFLDDPEQWPALTNPAAEEEAVFSWASLFRGVDFAIKSCERARLLPLRDWALYVAEQWITERFAESDGLGAIYPPIVWSAVALDCRGHERDGGLIRGCLEELEKLAIDEAERRRLQPCKSPVWDTTIALRAADASGAADARSLQASVDWLLSKAVTKPGDWAETVHAEPGGWFFEYKNRFYPDVDDSAMALIALRSQFPGDDEAARAALGGRLDELDLSLRTSARGERLIDCVAAAAGWLSAMQNRDGGWGAFDRDNDAEFLCHVPFADHNAMIDPSTPDITGRVLEAFGAWGLSSGDPRVDRALDYLTHTQEPDGSWVGRWGVNYIYGAWQTIVGMTAVGVPPSDSRVRRGADWLVSVQQSNGGWGETPASYDFPALRGTGPTTASQTAWAVLGLLAAGRRDDPAATRGIEYLLGQQTEAGDWREPEFTGTGFPRVFYLRYHGYRVYFPLLALSLWRDAAA